MRWNEEYNAIYRQNGKAIATIKAAAIEFAQTHRNLADIDHFVDESILRSGGEPAFKKVPGYKWATCISVNSGFVHGIPKGFLNEGDLVTLDTGMYLSGTTTDTAVTFTIGPPNASQQYFMKAGLIALDKTIKMCRRGNRIKDLAKTTQNTIESYGFNVTRNLTGHAVGKTMHEEPMIPNFVSGDPMLNTRLEVGMILAIEIMYMRGDWPLVLAKDGWTLSTKDGSDSAVFEEDVLITPSGPEILTR